MRSGSDRKKLIASRSKSASAAVVASSSREIGYSTCERMAAGLLPGGSPMPRAMKTFLESFQLEDIHSAASRPMARRRRPSDTELPMENRITDRVKQILSWYSSDSPGTLTNLARLLLHGRLGGTGKLVILPVDQGFEHGPARSFAPNPDGYDPRYHFQLAVDAGCNAYAAPLGFLEAGAAEYAGQVPLILKLNNSDSLSKLGGAPISAVTASVKDAVRLGCVAIGYTIYPASDARNEQLQNLRELTLEAKERSEE